MRTERQTQASRANGAKSSGPTTPEGKLASSRNAVTHGMLSGTIVLEGESKDRFRALLAALHQELQPQTPIEASLVENMAVARWRQMRIWGMEKAGMEHEMRRQAEASPSKEDTATRSALAFRTLSDDSRSLELINRYESRYDRQYLRAHRRLLELRDRPKPPPAQPQRKTAFAKRTREKRRTSPGNRYRKQKRQLVVFIRVHSWPKTFFQGFTLHPVGPQPLRYRALRHAGGIQMRRFLVGVDGGFSKAGTSEERQLVSKIEELAHRCCDEVCPYIRFVGHRCPGLTPDRDHTQPSPAFPQR